MSPIATGSPTEANGCQSGKPLELPLSISVLDHDVAAFDVTEVTQSLTEGLWQVGKTASKVSRKIAYARYLGRVLSFSVERDRTKRN